MLPDITIIDFETTGLQGGDARAVEVGAIRVHNGEIVAQFQTIIQQTKLCDPKAEETHGITPEMIAAGMPEKTAFAVLNNMSAGSVLVAHNMVFDAWFYNDALQRIGGRTLDAPLLCSLTMSRAVLGGKGHKLVELMERFDLKFTGAHRALNDCMGTYELLKILSPRCDFNDHVNKLGYKRWFGRPKWTPAQCYVFPQN